MPSLTQSTGLTITNPLVLYKSLLATKRIDPDPAQHRLALHLQKLYYRLKDYEPALDYRYELDRISKAVGEPRIPEPDKKHEKPAENAQRRSIFSSYREQKEQANALALTRRLTSHESAVQLQSPQGFLLYGEVGTGKSMLLDLLADCLPNRKKKRWHYNTFMLQTFAKLEQLRRYRLTTPALPEQEHSLLWLARDMISTSPILFLDEFQLPDRAASKILSNLLTCFFHLGGILVATSNRMPEELANASGVEFAAPPASRLGMLRNRWGLLGSSYRAGKSENMFAGKGDFAAFLEVLRARCEIWDMEGGKDHRRREMKEDDLNISKDDGESGSEQGFQGLQPMAPGNWGPGYEQSINALPHEQNPVQRRRNRLPSYYHLLQPTNLTAANAKDESDTWKSAVLRIVSKIHTGSLDATTQIPWQTTSLRVYGRSLRVPRQLNGITHWNFDEICAASLGPADYTTLASSFHTFILTGVPVLTSLLKNEARRFITLLDALYEARCKLLIRGAAGPDNLFFPETPHPVSVRVADGVESADSRDGIYPETFSEIYQDQVSPFRPNVSTYASLASAPSYDSPPLPSSSFHHQKSARSVVADEDSDFGPTYDAGRFSSSGYRGPCDGTPGAGNEIGHHFAPDFARTGSFTGEDEKFAYKRAQSRLWELCGAQWWAREEEGWWQPLSKELRIWESSNDDAVGYQADVGIEVQNGVVKEETLFRHGASPFRTSEDPPPKFPWTHAWGMMKWGKKAGAWGQGPDGLGGRRKRRTDVD
ncbi:MAG: hypothetical protein Q9166_003532 [cf. Caloplaca sp. 2 TL-2023]